MVLRVVRFYPSRFVPFLPVYPFTRLPVYPFTRLPEKSIPMSKLLKSVKIASKGFPAKCKQIVALSADTLQYHNSESSISVCLLPDHSRSLVEWASVAEFELSDAFEGLETEDKAIPEGYLPISSEEWQSVVWTSAATDNESTRYALGGVCFTGNT